MEKLSAWRRRVLSHPFFFFSVECLPLPPTSQQAPPSLPCTYCLSCLASEGSRGGIFIVHTYIKLKVSRLSHMHTSLCQVLLFFFPPCEHCPFAATTQFSVDLVKGSPLFFFLLLENFEEVVRTPELCEHFCMNNTQTGLFWRSWQHLDWQT